MHQMSIKLSLSFPQKNPRFTTGLIDRMLLVAERERLKGVVCINKIDLIDMREIDDTIAIYRKLKYHIYPLMRKDR